MRRATQYYIRFERVELRRCSQNHGVVAPWFALHRLGRIGPEVGAQLPLVLVRVPRCSRGEGDVQEILLAFGGRKPSQLDVLEVCVGTRLWPNSQVAAHCCAVSLPFGEFRACFV